MRTLAQFVGKELGVSAWVEMSQDRIDAFAACTGDHQWLHVDPERAKRESPFGGTVAHGFLTLSTVAPAALELLVKPLAVRQAVNCGVDKVRFIAPVRAGARIRTRLELHLVAPKGEGRSLVTMECAVEIEGEAKPALTAQLIFMVFE
jgi:acyl dehydratase